MSGRRVWSLAALLAAVGLVAALVSLVVGDVARVGLGVALLVVAAGLAVLAFVRAGIVHVVGLVVAALVFVVGAVLVLFAGHLVEVVLVVLLVVVVVVAVRRALRPNVRLPRVPAPRRPAMIWNAKSGDGKAVDNDLAGEARRRGIEPVELVEGTDLVALAHRLVDDGADGLAAAGGDGTQAIVAAVAAERDVPFACIPAGTRNHFALDLGVDRDDVVGALDAFVDGGERIVDLAEVNGRTFVNNCSIGLYAEAVQRREYRGAKLRTILRTALAAFGPSDEVTLDFSWTGPGGEREHGAAVVLVSNDVYRLGRGVGSGTRPRLDAGVLGVAVLRAPGAGATTQAQSSSSSSPLPWSTWSEPEFVIESEEPVNVGLDGEACTLDPPLRFVSRPRVLRVRVSHRHPGASPSAVQPGTVRGTIVLLWRMATGTRIEGLA